MEVNRKTLIVTGVGLVIGVAEALLYYNLGQSAGQKFKYKLPPTREFIKTISVVMVTSVMTAALSNLIESMLPEERMLSEKKDDKPKPYERPKLPTHRILD